MRPVALAAETHGFLVCYGFMHSENPSLSRNAQGRSRPEGDARIRNGRLRQRLDDESESSSRLAGLVMPLVIAALIAAMGAFASPFDEEATAAEQASAVSQGNP